MAFRVIRFRIIDEHRGLIPVGRNQVDLQLCLRKRAEYSQDRKIALKDRKITLKDRNRDWKIGV